MIFHSLIKCLESSTKVRILCKNCLLVIIKKLNNHALIYLPLVNATFTKYGFKNDPEFKSIIEKLKGCGDLENDLYNSVSDVRSKEEDHHIRRKPSIAKVKRKDYISNSIRRFSTEKVKRMFDVSDNFMKEDWEEWISATAHDLLARSPSIVLYSCKVNRI